jgi:hypothetical protein
MINGDDHQYLEPYLFVESNKRTWVEFISLTSVPWHLLMESGPWHSDARASFMVECFSWLKDKNYLSKDKEQWQELSANFRELVLRWRATLPGSFLPNFIVLVEGTTEAVLLPGLAKCSGVDLNSYGAMLIAAGGANQVARKYMHLKQMVSMPIFCLLDRDAQEQRQLITGNLRPEDCLYVLEDGEIEDVLKLGSLVPFLNDFLDSLPFPPGYCQPIQPTDFHQGMGHTAILERLWHERKLGKFDKVGFAKFMVDKLSSHEPISGDGHRLIKSLAAMSQSPTVIAL